MTHILILQGHPHNESGHLCHALGDAYAEGASEAGHQVSRIDVAAQRFDLIRDPSEFKTGEPAPDIKGAQEAISEANHIVLIYPLWLGTMPALLKGFFEQVMRPGFSFDYLPSGQTRPRLKGRSCRIVITMGMPALIYRWFFGAHSLKSLERNILKFVGFGPIRESLFGMVDVASSEKRTHWIAQMRLLGRKAA